MALATAAATAVATAISIHPFLSRPAYVLCCGRRLPPLLLRASSTSTSDFNITFAEPAPSKASGPGASAQPLVPWITRGEDGKPCLHTSPPPDVLQAVALAEAEAKRAKRDASRSQKGGALDAPVASVKAKEKKAAPAAPPKFSKAARRFYNENIRESEPQRLAKVLAAAGVASRRTSEELIFEGKGPSMVLSALLPRPKLTSQRILSTLMGTAFPRSSLQSCISLLTSRKGKFAHLAKNQSLLSPYLMTI